MSTITRGVRNAFRNPIRTGSVVALLGIASALALALLLANQAVKAKIVALKQSSATTLTVNAAGAFGGEGGGEPLTTTDLNKVKALANVAAVGALDGTGGGMFRISRGADSSGTGGTQLQVPTSQVQLDSSIDPGTLGRRRFRSSSGSTTDTNAPQPTIKLPVQMTGLIGAFDRTGQALNITAGTATFSAADVPEALVGQALATKNNLKLGSTFTAYDTQFKVVGIFDAGSAFANDGLYVPLATAQRLTGQTGEISQIFVKATSIDTLESVKSALTTALGSSRVDITAASQSTQTALTALASIQAIAVTGVIVALVASAIITFLIMVMIVRERRREIGVLKAIGGSNIGIVSQFMTEALVLTLCGAVLGIAIAAASSNQITGALVSANTAPSATTSADDSASSGPTRTFGRPGGGPAGATNGGFRGGFAARFGQAGQTTAQLVGNLQTNVGLTTLAAGLAAAIAIAALGSAIPAFLIAKIRPSEVLRGE